MRVSENSYRRLLGTAGQCSTCVIEARTAFRQYFHRGNQRPRDCLDNYLLASKLLNGAGVCNCAIIVPCDPLVIVQCNNLKS